MRHNSKSKVAQQLAKAHYRIDPGIELILQLKATPGRERNPKEPIKLLEVNENTMAAGIQPVLFGPQPKSGIDFCSVIVAVTPKEYRRIKTKRMSLPHGWRLGNEFPKPALARS